MSVEDLAQKTGFDPDKLDKWLYFIKNAGFILETDKGYLLSPKCMTFLDQSPLKDIVGFVRIHDFFMEAAVDCQETFRRGRSLDKLTEGKITRQYQPTVSDNLSSVLFKIFHQYDLKAGESLLDVGSGAGAFLRGLNANIPGLAITGFDSNIFAIETAKKENKRLGLSDQIRMLVGDATTDMTDFEDRSFDWVTAINVFHFFPAGQRSNLVDNMLRIARKGIFMTEILADTSPLSAGANPLMALLWNDFTGFFRQTEADELNSHIIRTHHDHKLIKYPILQDTSYLVAVSRKHLQHAHGKSSV